MLMELLQRIPRMVLTLFLVSIVVFSFVMLVPGDPAMTIAGESATSEQIEATSVRLGLDQPPYVQYLRWAGSALRATLAPRCSPECGSALKSQAVCR